MVDRIGDIWGARTPHPQDTPWPVRVDTLLDEGVAPEDVEHWVQSACLLCSNGCGADIAVRGGRMVGIRGRAADVVNHGRLGPKGLYGSFRAHHSPDRLTRPLVRDEHGGLVETDWDTAMGRIAERSRRLLAERGPLSHGFYSSGQLFLEEYYALGVIGKAGLGTPHMDGNTRLCTATAAASMKESFGSDGQPGSYTDIESADAIFLFGHNMSETQTVLWARVLDRVHGEDPPLVVAVDPRWTPVAQAARDTGGVHLAPLPSTNQALMNGLIRLVIANGWIDRAYIDAHTQGFDELCAVVEPYTPEHVAEICGIAVEDLRRAAAIFGTSRRVLSTVLQGFYQAAQATAASCSVNTLHLLRGMIGHAGAGILQMNGQPTAQNNREAGADGDLPAFRNWDNPEHVAELAALWDVPIDRIPHWSPPTHAMQIFRYAEQGSIELLWIAATNPAVSMPELPRIREILAREELFLVVQDAFLTETASYADVVLPAAIWGEKQGTFTNVNRTVHLSDKAVEPPGEARSDLDIFLDYARRMDFRRRDGSPLIPWREPAEVFDAWRECTRGRLCDYTGLSYEKLRGGSGIPWPCTEEFPEGCNLLYADGIFPTDPDVCETYGHDLVTGADTSRETYVASDPRGRAWLRAAPHVPAPTQPDDEYPFALITGRTAYHFHTRTKTARARPLDDAAPRVWAEVSAGDAERLGLAEGDVVRLSSPEGAVDAPVRVGRGRDGVVFVPFHFGYFDAPGGPPADGEPGTAANELIPTSWDPVSKQPLLKVGVTALRKIADATGPAPAPTTTASAPAGQPSGTADTDPPRGHTEHGAAGPGPGRRGVLPTGGGPDVEEVLRPVVPPTPPPTPEHTPNVPRRPLRRDEDPEALSTPVSDATSLTPAGR